MKSLHGCVALITGASSGIGAELARQLAPTASALVLVARRQDRLEALQAELARPGLDIHCYAVDLANAEQTEAFLRTLADSGVKVTFLVNNAGLGDHGLFENSDWSRVESMLDVNIKALTRLTHALLPQLVRARNAAILNVSSIVSYLPLPGMAVYAASKAYVTSFTEAIRGELRGTGVVVTALCPGPVTTEFGDVAQRPNEADEHSAPKVLKVPVERVVFEGLRAVDRNRARVVPGWLMATLMLLTSLVPIFLLRGFLGKKREL